MENKNDYTQLYLIISQIIKSFLIITLFLGYSTLLAQNLDRNIISDSTQTDIIYFGKINCNSSHKNNDKIFKNISTNFKDKIVTAENYKLLNQTFLSIPTQTGFHFPSISLINTNPFASNDSLFLNPEFHLDYGDSIVIDTLYFEGLIRTSNKLLLRELNHIPGTVYKSSSITNISNRLKRFPFLEFSNNDRIVKTKDGYYGLVLNIKETPNNVFNGVVGYVPQKKDRDGYFTGEFDLQMNNLNGSGRGVAVFWSKVNENSQELRLKYFEPWIWKTSLFGETEFHQVLRDTMVIIRKFNMGFGNRISSIGNIQLTFNYEATIPTPGGRQQFGLENTKSMAGGLKLITDNRINQNNPKKGFYLEIFGSAGKREESGISRTMTQAGINFENSINLYEQLVMTLKTNYNGKWLQEAKLKYSDQFWFGGANSLRGYPEDFFRGREIAIGTCELRWITGRYSRLYLFYDQGYYKDIDNKYNFPDSFGAGLRLQSRMGIIGIDYAFGENDNFSTAKIHLHIENKF